VSERTPLYDLHRELGARLVDFAGYEMPLHYGSQIEEHHRVRRAAGLFDVAHMGILDLEGPGTRALLRRLVANDVARLERDGRALYGCLLAEDGGVIDDLIVYRRGEERYRLVVNAATKDGDEEWIRAHAPPSVRIVRRHDLGLLALQGPSSPEILEHVLPGLGGGLRPFAFAEEGETFVARTGYTGEDGFEIARPADELVSFARRLLEAGAAPAGLGARDTLRLEAGLNLYGQDMDRSVTPLESNLAWTVHRADPGRDFIGRAALERQEREGVPRRLVGVLLERRAVLRHDQEVFDADGRPAGRITSGGFGPTLDRGLGLARLDAAARGPFSVLLHGRREPLLLVEPPFVRRGRPAYRPLAALSPS
jgi:aminomethyltransferase